MKVLETLRVLRLVMRHKKMSFVQLVEVLFGTSTLLSVVVTEDSRVTYDGVTDVLRLSPTVEIIVLNLGIGFEGDECILDLVEVFGDGVSGHIHRESDGKIQRIVGRLVTDDEAVFLEINSVMGNCVLWSGNEIEKLADLGLGRDSVEKVTSASETAPFCP
jgi:hypothetical protein